jgi:hypothetical protein
MIAELILIRKLLDKTPSLGSTPNRGVLPKFFKKRRSSVNDFTPITLGKPKTIAESFQDLPVLTEDTFVPRPPSKFTGDIFLKEYF